MPEILVLEIVGKEIAADQFVRGVRAFVSILKAVTRSVTDSRRGVEWLVGVRPGSVCAEFTARPLSVGPQMLPLIGDSVERGLVALETGQTLPPHFPDAAVPKVRELASLLTVRARPVDAIHVRRNGRTHDVTLQTLSHIDSLVGVGYRDWGTIEGTLETLKGRYGLEFIVYDPVTNRPVTCYFDEDILEDVAAAFTRRVSVSGVIRYRGTGEPVSVDVEDLYVFPREHELPSPEEVRGVFREVG